MRVERWEIDSGHSGIFFSIRHMALAKVRGQFTRWAGPLTAEEGDLRCASVDILIDASSISTGRLFSQGLPGTEGLRDHLEPAPGSLRLPGGGPG